MTKQNALHPNHTNDESVKEMHAKKAANVHPHRTVMQAMIVADVAYENVCSNARAVAAAAGLVYAPPTPAETNADFHFATAADAFDYAMATADAEHAGAVRGPAASVRARVPHCDAREARSASS